MTLFGQAHIDRYRATDGDEGYLWRNGTTILILTTTGRTSGKQRDHALIFREHDGDYVIVASKGGAPDHPEWYKNLSANAAVDVQVKGETFAAKARTAEGDERAELWDEMVEVWPDYANYQTKTDRQIPIVVLERTEPT
jgi:deazaflavin-dependent oxidoreductase (nitroreductase family)